MRIRICMRICIHIRMCMCICMCICICMRMCICMQIHMRMQILTQAVQVGQPEAQMRGFGCLMKREDVFCESFQMRHHGKSHVTMDL